MLKGVIRQLVEIVSYPFVLLFSPLFYFVARTGAGVEICRRMGFEPLLIHFGQPVPAYETLPESYFKTPQDLPGIKIDSGIISALLTQLGNYAEECNWPETGMPGQYYTQNPQFGYSSAILLYTLIRVNKGRRVFEIGSGFSTLISLQALSKNYPDETFQLTCIEPYPSTWLQDVATRYPNSVKLIKSKAQEVDTNTYLSLEAGDLLFIDGSHVAKLNSDVNFLFLQVLPRLKPGVFVHIHDIYIPYEYPRIHFYQKHKFYWNEQYMLHALLTGNENLEILLPGFYVQTDMLDTFMKAFPGYDPQKDRPTSSFWLKVR